MIDDLRNTPLRFRLTDAQLARMHQRAVQRRWTPASSSWAP